MVLRGEIRLRRHEMRVESRHVRAHADSQFGGPGGPRTRKSRHPRTQDEDASQAIAPRMPSRGALRMAFPGAIAATQSSTIAFLHRPLEGRQSSGPSGTRVCRSIPQIRTVRSLHVAGIVLLR
jgi:hypothetical protein